MTMRPSSNNRRGQRGDPAHASSVVKVLAAAGRASSPGRSIKRMLQLRYTTHLIRIGGASGCRASTNLAKTGPALKASSSAGAGTTGVRATAWRARTGRVNWGPSEAGAEARGRVGIIHKPPGGIQRRGYGHSKRGADRTIEPVEEPRAIGPVVLVRGSRCRLDASPTTEQTPGTEIQTVTAYKLAVSRPRRWPWPEAGLKPYWGKPTVRNFRGGGGNEVDGLMTFCHETRKGGYIGSHWPNHVRASALLGEIRVSIGRLSPPDHPNPSSAPFRLRAWLDHSINSAELAKPTRRARRARQQG